MKRLKKYPFFILIIVSILCYGGYRIASLSGGGERSAAAVSDGTDRTVSQVPPTPKGVEKRQQGESRTAEPDNIPAAAQQQVQEAQPEQKVAEIQAEVKAEPPSTRNFQRVEMDYLDDALFIGDSRTSTIYEYAGWDNTDFFVKYGQTVWDVWDNTMDGHTLEEMLSRKQYGKIYIMLGINELGSGTADSFGEQFQNVVQRVREMEPDAVIFVEAIMHVTASKDAKNTYINNAEINARNQRLEPLADNINIFYIDVNEVMDEPGTGVLKEEYAFDGVHLQVKYLDIWREFLLDHGIV